MLSLTEEQRQLVEKKKKMAQAKRNLKLSADINGNVAGEMSKAGVTHSTVMSSTNSFTSASSMGNIPINPPSSPSVGKRVLTVEELRQIEDNKQKAMAKKKSHNPGNVTVCEAKITPEQRKRSEENRLKAIAKRTPPKVYPTSECSKPTDQANRSPMMPTKSFAERMHTENNTTAAMSASCRRVSGDVSSSNRRVTLTAEQQKRIEENRLKAIAKRTPPKVDMIDNVHHIERGSHIMHSSAMFADRIQDASGKQQTVDSHASTETYGQRTEHENRLKTMSPQVKAGPSSNCIPERQNTAYNSNVTLTCAERIRLAENKRLAMEKKLGKSSNTYVTGDQRQDSVQQHNMGNLPTGSTNSILVYNPDHNINSYVMKTPVKSKAKELGLLQGKCVMRDECRFEVQVPFCKSLITVFKTMKSARYDPALKIWNFHISEYPNLMFSTRKVAHLVDISPLPVNNTSHDMLHDMTAGPSTSPIQAQSPVKMLEKISVKGTCVLCSRDRFEIQAPYCGALVEVCKTMKSRQYNATNKRWNFGLQDYDVFVQAIKALGTVSLDPLPPTLLRALRGKTPDLVSDFSAHIPPGLDQALFTFQRQGVGCAISRNGRLLIADDMGLGKTIQAIAIAAYYRSDWPVLVVAPSSVRFTWAEQFKKWLPYLSQDQINVVANSNSPLMAGLVNITSYDLLTRKKAELEQVRFNVVILDESHFIKNHRTSRAKAALPICNTARRVLLLSGTPCLSRPVELFTQIKAIDSSIFPLFVNFGLRYCDGKQTKFGWDYSGSSNEKELEVILKEKIMIRRLKFDVLDQLPDKRRQVVVLDPASVKIDKAMKAANNHIQHLKGQDRKSCLMQYFSETGKAKVPAVIGYILDMLESDKKFIVFAHHREVLDLIQEAVQSKRYGFVRIDGSTTSAARQENCHKFQTDANVRLIILSITAANAGLNLTMANLVIFAELFWNPGILVQAEDRAHRIGQKDSVLVQYLVAKDTADDFIWPLVQNKLAVLSKTGLTKDNFLDADTTNIKDPTQKKIFSFFEEAFINDSCNSTMNSLEDRPSTSRGSGSDIKPQDDEEQPRKKARL